MMSAVVSSANIHLKRPEQTKRVIYVDIKTGEQVLIINKSHSCPGSRSSSVSSPCSTPVHSRPSSAISSQSSTESSSSSSSDKSRNLKGAISKYLCGVNSNTQVNE